MPDNKNQDQDQDQKKDRGNPNRSQQGTIDTDKNPDQNVGRQPQGNKGQQGGNKGSTGFEKDDAKQVGNDNDVARELEDENEDERITQRRPRQADQGQQGNRDMSRNGQAGPDRKRDRE